MSGLHPAAASPFPAPRPSAATLLVGRSGTGKTTCALYRLYFAWEAARSKAADEPFHQIFVTASATLRQQVESSFRKLQNAVRPRGAEQGQAPQQGQAGPLRDFMAVPEECAGHRPCALLIVTRGRLLSSLLRRPALTKCARTPWRCRPLGPQGLAALPHLRGVPPNARRHHLAAAPRPRASGRRGRRCARG